MQTSTDMHGVLLLPGPPPRHPTALGVAAHRNGDVGGHRHFELRSRVAKRLLICQVAGAGAVVHSKCGTQQALVCKALQELLRLVSHSAAVCRGGGRRLQGATAGGGAVGRRRSAGTFFERQAARIDKLRKYLQPQEEQEHAEHVADAQMRGRTGAGS